MPEPPVASYEWARRAPSPDSGVPVDGTEAGRREGSLRGLAAMIRLSNVRHAAPEDRALPAESVLPDDETILRRATLLADAIERLDKLGLRREDAAALAGLTPDELDRLLQGDLGRFDEETLSIVLGRLAGGAAAFEGEDGAEERA